MCCTSRHAPGAQGERFSGPAFKFPAAAVSIMLKEKKEAPLPCSFYDGIIPSRQEGKRLFADQTFADRHLPKDFFLNILL